jgi:hypothetical protein
LCLTESSNNMNKYSFKLKAEELKSHPNNRVQDNLYMMAFGIETAHNVNERFCIRSWFNGTPKSSRSTVTRILRKRGFKVYPNSKDKTIKITW